ncbi:MAG TPA: endopeptidase La [bacterium]|nr:endopeptidase La [bacterium]HOL46837.1 endopeptidase La [bacterium]HPQ18637.1 endopeptidase La [bacterium]
MEENKTKELIIVDKILPEKVFVIPIQHRPLFPGMILPLIVPESKYTESIEKAISLGGYILLLLIKNKVSNYEDIKSDDLYLIGTVGQIVKKINLPDNSLSILINSIKRAKVKEFVRTELFMAAVEYLEEKIPDKNDIEIKAFMREILLKMKKIAEHNPAITEELKLTMLNVDDPSKLSDFVISVLNLKPEDYQLILEELDVKARLEKVLYILKKEMDLIEIQEKVKKSIEEKIQKTQKEFFLKEQLKEIKKELGIKNLQTKAYIKYKKKLKELDITKEVYDKLKEDIINFETLDSRVPEYSVQKSYLDTVFSLPWKKKNEKIIEENIDLEKAQKILDKDHYGLKEVKERIIEFLAVKKRSNKTKGFILCFVGPPGVGKTSLGQSIAKTLNRKFFRFSVGGMRDEAEIKGHRRTYIGAMPGKIIQALKITKSRNPIIMLDEIDKIGTHFTGDPASALLEVLDPEQNKEFRDHYIDLPFDISEVLFITTANTLDTIPEPLKDRMEIISLSGYILEEKIEIAKRYLIPKLLEKTGLSNTQVKFNKKGLIEIINSYSREAGVRSLEKNIEKILRKICVKIEKKEIDKIELTQENIKEFLGQPKFVDESKYELKKPGLVYGLAWTPFGGDVLIIETLLTKGKDRILLTGQLGDVMKESANIAYSLAMQFAIKNGVDEKIFSDNVIHIHVPAGATPKDGPSAGITITTAIFSLVLNKVIKKRIAMTGEISLSGSVLPIGGLKEKIIAAKRYNIKEIIIPFDNEKDLTEIPDYIKKNIIFHKVKEIEEVFKITGLL